MNWLNIETATLDSEEFVGSDPVARATWLCLLRYCAGQENGGIIAGCGQWADRKWQQIVRVTEDEVSAPSALWTWEGEDLHLWAYPTEKEAIVQTKREAGARGGRSRTEAKAEAARANGAKHNPSRTQAPDPSTTQAETQRKGKEGKGKEGEENMLVEVPTDAQAIYQAYPRKQGRQDAMKAIERALHACPAERLLERTKAYAAAVALWPAGDRQFIPHPSTWFNRGSYEDDPATWARTSSKPGQLNADQVAKERAEAGGLHPWELDEHGNPKNF